ncbi:MAG: AbrB/MazE/SpoVT family DNA-binding domain-containing protein [Acidobacteria bacterium]|nr:AbrB/MazE/SpoVT family DNA-binding domain-containing protein [Acidobacteriota bacterium]
MQTSKLSSKSQVTLPKEVREAIGARPGDTIVYEVEGEVVRLRRQDPFDAEFHNSISATLSEWASTEDEEAFNAL